MADVLYWRNLTSREISNLYENAGSCPVFIIFPVGVIEAHGPYLPLGFDSMVVRLLSHLVVENVQELSGEKARLVIFDSLADLGVISATFELDGGIPYSGMLTTELLFQTMQTLFEKSIRNYFVINGDGGTGNSMRALMFRSDSRRRDFFRAFGGSNGSFNFITWFDGVKKKIEHAGVYEHALLKYLSDLADVHTRALAEKFDLSARLLTHENLRKLEHVPAKEYLQPRTEIISWKMLDGQEEFAGSTPFCLAEYREILESGAVALLWKQQLEKVTDYVHKRIAYICGWRTT
jgi:creatinine amidohydrolase/Fe(II)-dependent formamide hydrolase-like protein